MTFRTKQGGSPFPRIVFPNVLESCCQFEIVRVVIRFVVVLVMNQLAALQRATQDTAHNDAMFIGPPVRICERMADT
jgi:large-conductance mechanosensitive channel